MSTYHALLRFGWLAALAASLTGCTSKYARFQTIVVPQADAKAVFGATETVLHRYFSDFKAFRADEGLISTEKSKVLHGNLPEDEYNVFATALVSQQSDGAVVHLKVQRTKVIGRWTWVGLGVSFYEEEVFKGTDKLLTEKIKADLIEEIKTPAAAEAPTGLDVKKGQKEATAVTPEALGKDQKEEAKPSQE